ncbi:STAS/SEC14 domain-containing protein [Roseinatronobacter sp.]|uniref:STAS/SEC14 domain-containing protein n=1 Tax=Roseinatronobacter sp. TaxID=1945755 RepID=UPI0025DD8A15|nr:STAS/SEC14 domain-containing protein [Roseibaca sp.]
MIEIEHSHQDDNVVIRATGTVSRRDIDLAVPEIEQALELAEKPLKLMIRLEDFEGWEIGGLWEDIVFSLERRGEFGRIAVIGESALEKWTAMLAAPFAGSELQVFRQENEDAARAWLGMSS